MKSNLTPIHLGSPDLGVAEMQIQQALAGLKLMPAIMVPALRNMAARGDQVAIETIKRYDAEMSQP